MNLNPNVKLVGQPRRCKHCNYKWEQRFRNRKPRQCPYCKSPKWDQDLREEAVAPGETPGETEVKPDTPVAV
jgi:hypothetical protein